MATEKRLIDVNDVYKLFDKNGFARMHVADIDQIPRVDAVEVLDKKLLKAIKLLIKQYEYSKNSDYVHHPVAHALYHTWKKLDEGRGAE